MQENPIFKTIVVSVVISAVVGAVFGYYGASFFGPAAETGDTFIRSITNQSFSDDNLVIETAKKSSPAVVSIVATKDLVILEQRRSSLFEDFCGDPFFRQFFNSNECAPRQSTPPRTKRQQVSAGSGFLVSRDGLIVTNKHVVDIEQADFTVVTTDGKKYPAKVLAKDPFHDLAVVKITGTGFPVLSLGNSDQLQIGQSAIAIGNALGEFSNTVSRGVVSGLSRSIVASAGNASEKLEQLIQTDAAINPGNSGGPLLNLKGEVVGVNTAIVQGAQSIGFAIPINQVKKAVNDVRVSGKISYPLLGVRYAMITPEIKVEKKLAVDQGALIVPDKDGTSGVVGGSPAEKVGLKDGDVILEINGKKLTIDNDLAKVIQSAKVGEQITLKVWHEGETKLVKVTLEERK